MTCFVCVINNGSNRFYSRRSNLNNRSGCLGNRSVLDCFLHSGSNSLSNRNGFLRSGSNSMSNGNGFLRSRSNNLIYERRSLNHGNCCYCRSEFGIMSNYCVGRFNGRLICNCFYFADRFFSGYRLAFRSAYTLKLTVQLFITVCYHLRIGCKIVRTSCVSRICSCNSL